MNKKLLTLSALVCLLPVIIGLVLWNSFPAQMPTHWNAAGEVDGYMSRAVTIIGLPLFLAVMHVLTVVIVFFDPKNANGIPPIMRVFIYGFMPVLTIIVMSATYVTALGGTLPVAPIVLSLTGILFIALGYAMRDIKPNYSMGIRLPWTLHSEQNWVRTHALASKLWMAIGAAQLVLCGMLNLTMLLFPLILLAVLVPAGYSFWLYRHK